MQKNILEYLDETEKQVPEKIAFCGEKGALTFRQLKVKGEQIAELLLRKGAKKEPIAVLMEKSPEEVAAFLGILGAGCYYVPLDEEMPFLRMQAIVENTGVRMFICDRRMRKTAEELVPKGIGIVYEDVTDIVCDFQRLSRVRARTLDIDPAYIVFTSGSTGTPKGVTGSHRNVIDYVDALTEVLHLDDTCIFANQAPFCIDASVREIYAAIKLGATAYLIPSVWFMSPLFMLDFLIEKRVNTVCWAVSALTILSRTGALKERKLTDLKRVAFVGEVFPGKQFKIWQEEYPEVEFTNLYGPTEATGVCCYYHVNRKIEEDEVIPIGFPFPNTDVLLLDERGNECEEGEIYIRGAGVTLGYYLDGEKTEASFVQNPMHSLYPERVYRTGDIGRFNENGELVFVARKDAQIKHMGRRIDPGEIEYYVSRLEGIAKCCCLYDKEKRQLVLFWEGNCEKSDVLRWLKEFLPRYMLPGRMERLEKMPLTQSFKVDRKKLEDIMHGRIG